jgi:hypothetical protein
VRAIRRTCRVVTLGATPGHVAPRHATQGCRQPRQGHVAWERRQPRRGCAANPRASHAGAQARRPQATPCASRPHARRGLDRATPGARRAAPRRCAQDGPRRATYTPRRGTTRRAGGARPPRAVSGRAACHRRGGRHGPWTRREGRRGGEGFTLGG